MKNTPPIHITGFTHYTTEMHIAHVAFPTSNLAEEIKAFALAMGCRDLKSEVARDFLLEMSEDPFLSPPARDFLKALLRTAPQRITDFAFDFSAAFSRGNIPTPPDPQLPLF